MKKEIIKFVDSIEGFGNLVVTKPDGTTQKHGFKNTITEHFRNNLINAILYGDEEKVFDENGNETPNANPSGYYWSNKLIGYQFKVTVGVGGTPNNYPSQAKKNLVRDGFNKTIDFSEINEGQIGESRYNVIGTVDTNQAQLVDGFTPQELRLGKDINPDTGEWTTFNQQKAFDFSQNVFTGYTEVTQAIPGTSDPVEYSIIPGLKQPKFRPARENVKLYYDGTETKTTTTNIDKWTNMAKSWFDWDVVDPINYNGVQATLRQSMGAATWKVHAHKTNNEELVEKYGLGEGYDANGVAWGDPDSHGDGKTTSGTGGTIFSMPDNSKFVQYRENDQLLRATITDDFYWNQNFDGEDSQEFFPVAFELYQPDERWYWSFSSKVENTARYDLVQASDNKKWMARDVETQKTGQIIAIEVMNFPSKVNIVGTQNELAVDPETIAYHCPTMDSPIKIDRNDNLTVEYNFKFTTPQSGTVTWNGMYLDELARAINPVKDTEQTTNSANQIQMTGAVLFEKGVFEDTNEVHTVGGHRHTYVRNVPDKIQKKSPKWTQSDSAVPVSDTNSPNSPPVNNSASVVDGTIVDRELPNGKLNPNFARIWVSPYADLFVNKTGGAANIDKDFTNDLISIDKSPEVNTAEPYNYTNVPSVYTANTIEYRDDTWTDNRSFYAQSYNTYKYERNLSTTAGKFTAENGFDYFQHMVSLFFDNIQKIDFQRNRCQVFLSPYGNISKSIVRHAKLTEWLNTKEYSIYLDGNSNQTNVPPAIVEGVSNGHIALYNIETIWQNGLRLFSTTPLETYPTPVDPDNITPAEQLSITAFYTALHNVVDDAVVTLKFGSTDSKDSFMIPSKDEGKSVIHLKATSDSRFLDPPAFFTVNYGSQFGHPVPGDMHDQKIESKWVLKDDWMKELNKLTAAGGFNSPSSVDWSDYYRVEDRDMIEQLDTHALEHYLGLHDPTGFGENGFLVNYWENSVAYPVWDGLQLSTEKKTGISVLHDSDQGTYGTTVDQKKVLQKINAFKDYLNPAGGSPKALPEVTEFGEVSFKGTENRLIYNGQLYSHIDGELLWDFRINPVNVFGYIDENQFSVEEPQNTWTWIENDEAQTYPAGHTASTVALKAGETLINEDGVPVSHDDIMTGSAADAAGVVPTGATWAVDDVYTTHLAQSTSTIIDGSSAPDMVGNYPINARWKLGDTYTFVDGTPETLAKDNSTVVNGESIAHNSITGSTEQDWNREELTIVADADPDPSVPATNTYSVSQATSNWGMDIDGDPFVVGTGQKVIIRKSPTHIVWGPGDQFVLSAWDLKYYDQFLGQRFTQRGTTAANTPEFTTTWEMPQNFYTNVTNDKLTAAEQGVYLTGDADISGNVKTVIDVSVATAETEENGGATGSWFISDRISEFVTAESEYGTYIATPTVETYKALLVRMKQKIGMRNIQSVKLSDYVQRKIEFDPQIYEDREMTDTGVRYVYKRQGDSVSEISGVYSASDDSTYDAGTNYATALQNGYKETAPFRVKWPTIVNDSTDYPETLASPILKLKSTSIYGRFTTAGETHTFGDYGTTATPVQWATDVHYAYTETDTAENVTFTPEEMTTRFPIYDCWAQRLKSSVAIADNMDSDTGAADTRNSYDFPIPKSFKLSDQLGQAIGPLETYSESAGAYNDGSTNLSVTELKMDDIDEHGVIPFPSIVDMVKLVKAKEKVNYFKSDQELLQFVTSIAPYGFKEFYEYDDATPSNMRLSLPHPNYHMFYGDITIGGSNATTAGAGAVDGPTWTPGDKVIMDWIVKPPASGSGGAS